MQAKLPDVNAAIVRHRSLAEEGFKTENFDLVVVSVECIIALLPIIPELNKNYKVEVNTKKYNALAKEKKTITCRNCKHENFLELVEQFEVELDWLEQIIANKKFENMWLCLNCKKSSIFNNDDITITKNGEPFYYKVIPSPPSKEFGIMSRKVYEREFKKWFSIAMPEIESQIGVYRTEYAAQQEEQNLQELPPEVI